MKFVKVQNHVYNLACIFDLFFTIREEENFNRKIFSYYIRTTGGVLVEISQFEYKELENILFKNSFDDAEA